MGEEPAPELLWPIGTPEEAGAGVAAWCWSLAGKEAEAVEQLAELSAEEQARAGRFKFRVDRRRYVRAHLGMQRVLAAYAEREPRELVLGRGAHGKPYLVGGEGLGFNLTHSGNVAVLAVGWGVEVGVDVERVVPEADHPTSQLSEREQAYLRGVPAEERADAFYRCWTRKEALLKGMGMGLIGKMEEFSALPGWDRAEASRNAGTGWMDLEAWRLQELVPAVGYTGCVAVPEASVTVRCFRLGEWPVGQG